MSFGRTKYDRSVVSEVKTGQWPTGSDTPDIKLNDGRFNLCHGLSSSGYSCYLLTKEEGYPLEPSTDDSCFFSPAITDDLLTRHLTRSYRHFQILRLID